MTTPNPMPETVPTALVLQLVASLSLADHLCFAYDDVSQFLGLAGIEMDCGDDDDFPFLEALAAMGVTTLDGGKL